MAASRHAGFLDFARDFKVIVALFEMCELIELNGVRAASRARHRESEAPGCLCSEVVHHVRHRHGPLPLQIFRLDPADLGLRIIGSHG